MRVPGDQRQSLGHPPLIALQYHEVKLNVQLRPFEQLVVALDHKGQRVSNAALDGVNVKIADKPLGKCAVYADYIYLDTEERTRFSKQKHEYLITQLQRMTEAVAHNASTHRIMMHFNHPVKELVFTMQHTTAKQSAAGTINANDLFNWTANAAGAYDPSHSRDLLDSAKISLNGHDRFDYRPAEYFRLVQPFNHHTCVPSKPIYVYSFAMRPEDHQPSGTCNFSRIDNAVLEVKLSPSIPKGTDASGNAFAGQQQGSIELYAVNYNVLQIHRGLAGTSYAN